MAPAVSNTGAPHRSIGANVQRIPSQLAPRRHANGRIAPRSLDCRQAWHRRIECRTAAGAIQQQSSSSQLDDDPHSHFWEWNHPAKPRIHYWKMGNTGPPVLLLHGFGVGCYHFGSCMERLCGSHRVWAVDLLGQGRSWPRDSASMAGYSYSVDMWAAQVTDFIRSEIGEPVYLAGNSLGGFVAAAVASMHPDLCRGVVLLNATPFWAFNKATSLVVAEAVASAGGAVAEGGIAAAVTAGDVVEAGSPVNGSAFQFATGSSSDNNGSSSDSSGSSGGSNHQQSRTGSGAGGDELDTAQSPTAGSSTRSSGSGNGGSSRKPKQGWLWNGELPAPSWAQRVGAGAWDWIRNTGTIRRTLRQVYTNEALVDQALADRILEAARNDQAFDAFLSILFAPQSRAGGFDGMLRTIQQQRLPLLLCYGRDDPWVRSIWGQRIVRIIPEASYYQLSPSGHCPQDEAPELTAECMASWIAEQEEGGPPLLQIGQQKVDGNGITLLRTDDSPSGRLETFVTAIYGVTNGIQNIFKRVFR